MLCVKMIRMNVAFSCPRCEQANDLELVAGSSALLCPHCRAEISVPHDAFVDGKLERCVVCPSVDLFVRKDFPQRWGVGIVVFGFAVSCVTWYLHHMAATFAVLFSTALVDFVLYRVVGDALVCYRCGAHYRHINGLENHARFDLETHERYRQQAARLAEERARRLRDAVSR